MLVCGITILHAAFLQSGIVAFGSTPASKTADGFIEKTPPARPPAAVTVTAPSNASVAAAQK
jgi:hypothetical protein